MCVSGRVSKVPHRFYALERWFGAEMGKQKRKNWRKQNECLYLACICFCSVYFSFSDLLLATRKDYLGQAERP